MNNDVSQVASTTNIAATILKLVLEQWQPIFAIAQKTISYLTRERPTGLFEVLEYDSTLELLDTKGEKAIFHRRQKVRFLQDHVIAFQDHVWGDGNVIAKYQVSPGVVVDKYKEGNRWNILISLRESRNKGDIDEFLIERTARGSFLADEEWFQAEVGMTTRHLRLAVIFPKQRPCRRAVLVQRSKNRAVELDRHYQSLPDGRQMVVWEQSYPRRTEIFTLKWEW